MVEENFNIKDNLFHCFEYLGLYHKQRLFYCTTPELYCPKIFPHPVSLKLITEAVGHRYQLISSCTYTSRRQTDKKYQVKCENAKLRNNDASLRLFHLLESSTPSFGFWLRIRCSTRWQEARIHSKKSKASEGGEQRTSTPVHRPQRHLTCN